MTPSILQSSKRRCSTWALCAALVSVLSGCGTGNSSGDNDSGNANSSGDNDSGANASGSGLGSDTGGGLSSSDPMCAADAMKQWVDDNMRDYYLFFDQVPQVRLADYDTPENLIADLRVKPYDRFSYIADEAQNTALFEEGIQFGFGWKLARTSDTDVQFLMVYPNSPIGNEGVKRGDYLTAIDGIDVNQITGSQIDASLGTGTQVTSPTLTITSSTGVSRDIQVTKTEFKLQTVLERSMTFDGAQNIAYLNFVSFLETSTAEINEAFDYFVQQQANELVLDLRYNGGGRISVARDLASKIVGNVASNQEFVKFALNSKYAQYNDSMPFETTNNALNLSRVFILSSSNTCSASEMIINGLSPFMEVITVGDTSCGKPYGTRPVTRCGKVMNALEFEFQNASGVGGYFNGIAADCGAEDFPLTKQGSSQDNLFNAARNYMNNGSCALLAADNRRSRVSKASYNPMLDEKEGILKP